MRANLSRRLIIWIGGPATLLFAGVVGMASYRSVERVVDRTEQLTRGLARYYAAKLDGTLSRAAKIPENLRLVLESHAFRSEETLEAFLRDVIERNPEVYGSCLAFEPGTFTPGKHYYAPYYYRKDGKAEFVQLGNPDYNYFKWEWYDRPKAQNQAIWTEPYFDEGGGNAVMTTYSVPFHQADHTFWGIATIDIAMTQLVAEAARLEVGRSGYAFIVSKQGRFLAYPDQTKIMKGMVQEANADLGRRMMAGEGGFLRTAEPLQGRMAWVAFEPIQGGEFSLAVVYPEAEVLSEARRLEIELLAIGGIGLAALFGALIIVSRSISRPITQLAKAAQEVARGHFEQRVDENARTDEVRDLGSAFNRMTRELQMRMEELRYTTRVQERMEGELSAARTIQMSMLVKRFPAFPERREIDLHGIVKPARAVGGDFYDFYFVDRDHLCLMIGDVAGKGVPAALYMAVSKTLLRANAAPRVSAAELLTRVNNELHDDGNTGMFVSLAYALLDVSTGNLESCSAGHPAPLLLRQTGGLPC